MSSVSNVSGASSASYVAPKKADTSKKQASTDSSAKKTEAAAVYEKSSVQSESKKPTYSINKMSEKDRSAIVKQMQADTEQRQSQLVSIVQDMMKGQGKAYSQATGNDSIWKFLASGDFTVDPATKAQAQEDISEDGYWGVKQTSQRLFDFASALAGDDPEKMQKMQAAIEKGYALATGEWGKDLPDISRQTMDATNQLFKDYYESKGVATE